MDRKPKYYIEVEDPMVGDVIVGPDRFFPGASDNGYRVETLKLAENGKEYRGTYRRVRPCDDHMNTWVYTRAFNYKLRVLPRSNEDGEYGP